MATSAAPTEATVSLLEITAAQEATVLGVKGPWGRLSLAIISWVTISLGVIAFWAIISQATTFYLLRVFWVTLSLAPTSWQVMVFWVIISLVITSWLVKAFSVTTSQQFIASEVTVLEVMAFWAITWREGLWEAFIAQMKKSFIISL